MKYRRTLDSGIASRRFFNVDHVTQLAGFAAMIAFRSSSFVPSDGKIAKVFPKVQPKQHDDLLLGALAELA